MNEADWNHRPQLQTAPRLKRHFEEVERKRVDKIAELCRLSGYGHLAEIFINHGLSAGLAVEILLCLKCNQ
jgi:hypothetical protein